MSNTISKIQEQATLRLVSIVRLERCLAIQIANADAGPSRPNINLLWLLGDTLLELMVANRLLVRPGTKAMS
jgi:hypothetical protein